METRDSLAVALLVPPMLASAGTDDEDAGFDDAVRDFGFTSGAGSVMPVDNAKCPEFFAGFEKKWMNRSIAK